MEPQAEKSPDKAPELKGILVYVGTTGAGKTYLAFEHLKELARKGVNCVIIDSASVDNFREVDHVESLSAVGEALWGKKRGVMVAWTPRDIRLKGGEVMEAEEQFERLCKAVQEAKGEPVALLVDEVSFWKDSRELKTLCRTWRHSNATVLVTSQHVSADIGQVLFGCSPTLFLFRTTAPRSLEFIMRWHGLDPDQIRGMPDRKYVVKKF